VPLDATAVGSPSYDRRGRKRFAVTPAGIRETQYAGLLTTGYDEAGTRTDALRDGAGSITEVTQYPQAGAPPRTRYVYDPLGRLRLPCQQPASGCALVDGGLDLVQARGGEGQWHRSGEASDGRDLGEDLLETAGRFLVAGLDATLEPRLVADQPLERLGLQVEFCGLNCVGYHTLPSSRHLRGEDLPRLSRSGRRWALPSRGGSAVRGQSVRILGLDPGSQATGFGVIDWIDGDARYVASGAIRTTGSDFPPRLRQIFEGVLVLMREHAPTEVAIERVFMHRNADSALKLGQARGAALCAAFSTDPAVFEYAPREVKLAVVGQGGAQKEQVQLMVKTLLRLEGELGPDAADAIGIALCHAYSRQARMAVSGSVAGGTRP